MTAATLGYLLLYILDSTHCFPQSAESLSQYISIIYRAYDNPPETKYCLQMVAYRPGQGMVDKWGWLRNTRDASRLTGYARAREGACDTKFPNLGISYRLTVSMTSV